MTVAGAGSALTTNGDRLTVGRPGVGTLSVLVGGLVTSGAAYADTEAALSVGTLASVTGSVTVSGAGSVLAAAGLAVLGGANSGAGLAAGGTGTVLVTAGGLFRAANVASFAGSALSVDASGISVIGASAGTAWQLTVDQGASLSGAGAVHAAMQDNGTITATGGTLVVDAVRGTGVLAAQGGTLVLGSVGGETLQFLGVNAVIQVGALAGNGQVIGFTAGDTLDFGAGLAATLARNVITLRQGAAVVGTETLGPLAPALQRCWWRMARADRSWWRAMCCSIRCITWRIIRTWLGPGGSIPALHRVRLERGTGPQRAVQHQLLFGTQPDHARREPAAELRQWRVAGGAQSVGVAQRQRLFGGQSRCEGGGRRCGRALLGERLDRGPEPERAVRYQFLPHAEPGHRGRAHRSANAFRGVWLEGGRDPSLLFSDAKHLAANPDIAGAGAGAGIDPLLHYVQFGQGEGRVAFLAGGSATADPLVNAAYYDPQLGATLIPTGVTAQQ